MTGFGVVGGALRRVMIAAVLGLVAFAVQGANVAEPAPGWVDWIEPAKAPPPAGGSERVAVLTDDQAFLEGDRTEWFHRRVSQVTASSGTDDASELTVSYDPAYETVAWHGAWVERDGVREDRLANARIDELRREGGLESGLIDGKHSLHLVLDDVRVGDIVDIALTVRGRNPALAGQGYAYWSLQVGIPTQLRRLRVVHPAAVVLPFKAIGAVPEARRTRQGAYETVEWTLHDALPRRSEENATAWFDAGPSVEFGGARDWAGVVKWALPLYAGVDDPAIASLARELGLSRGDASEANVRRAIAFVQDEIRYTGLELGAHAYEPYPPSEVIRRRYGDCKDKTTLLAGLLRHLGLEAHAALVDVDELEHVAARLPSPGAFDHAIVHFVRDGRDYWIDATAEMQRGRLDRLAQADFGRALVIAPGETALREMAVPAAPAPRIEIEEEFDLRDAEGGLAKHAAYSIRTLYRGTSADGTRRRFARESAQEIGEGYAASIEKHYPGLEMAQAPRIEDDTERNEVTVHERYVINDVWRPDDSGDGTHATFWLNELDGYLPEPGGSTRRSPLALGGPLDIRQKLTLRLDGGWPAEDAEKHVENEHFDFRRTIRNDGDVATVEGRLQLHSRDVPAADAGKLAADLRRANAAMGYELTLGAESGTEEAPAGPWVDWRLLPVLLAMLASWAWVAFCALRRGDSVWRGMWFQPRATTRAALQRNNTGEAAVLLVLATAGSALLETDKVATLGNSSVMLIALLGAGAAAGVLGLFVYALYAALMAWGGRLFGGEGRTGQVWMGMGWAQVPAVAMLPTLGVLVGLYGVELDATGVGPALVAMVLVLCLLVLPLGVWSALIWFPVLAEIHRITLPRAVAVTFAVPLAVVLLLFLLVVGVRALAGG